MMNQNYTLPINPASLSFHYSENIIPLAWEIYLSEPDLIVPPGLINFPRWGNYTMRPLQIMDFRGLCTSGAWTVGHSVTVCHVLSERLDDSGHSIPWGEMSRGGRRSKQQGYAGQVQADHPTP